MQQTKPRFGRLQRSPAWKQRDYHSREVRDGQKEKIGKANEKRKKGKIIKKSKR